MERDRGEGVRGTVTKCASEAVGRDEAEEAGGVSWKRDELCYHISLYVNSSKEGVLVGPFQIILFIVWALSTLALIALVLMHSGKGTGVSDMIASSLYNSSAATGVMEQNLDKLTVIVACVFAACVVLAMFFFPQGIVGI